MSDQINHPPHYTQSGIEPITVIEAWKLGFCLGNVVKYIARAEHKGSLVEDLQKAAWYLNREIERRLGAVTALPAAAHEVASVPKIVGSETPQITPVCKRIGF